MVSQQRIKELQNQVVWLYNKYFKNIQQITLTALEILSDRVFPHIARNYNDWNVPPQSVSFFFQKNTHQNYEFLENKYRMKTDFCIFR